MYVHFYACTYTSKSRTYVNQYLHEYQQGIITGVMRKSDFTSFLQDQIRQEYVWHG